MVTFFLNILLNFLLRIEKYSQLTMLRQFLVDSKETQLYVYMYPFSPQFTSHPGCHLTLGRVPCRFFLVILFFSINFKYSSGYTSIPNSLTRGIVFQHVKLRGTQTFIPQQTYLNKYSFLVFRYTLSASREGIIITPSFLKELF